MKIFFFFLLFLSKVKANEIFNIRIVERDDYIRILFETKEKPNYFVNENTEEHKIEAKIKNAKLVNLELCKTIKTDGEIKGTTYQFTDSDSIFTINLFDNASLKRYLYTEPDNVNNFYRLVIDINRKQKEELDDIISSLGIERERKNLNEFLYEENMFEFRNIDELIAYNDISSEEIKSFEKQNNDDFEMNILLNKIYKLDENQKTNIKSKENKEIEKPKIAKEKEELKTTKIADIVERTSKQNKFVVVIDAGHGGKDPGAIGQKKLKEKDVNLIYAQEIKKELEKYRDIAVILTRNRDEYIPLFDRVILAMESQADLFISVHSDSSTNKSARGTSIYSLNEEAFNTRTIEIIKQVNGLFSYMKNRNTLISKAREQNLRKSSTFANIVVSNFKNSGVRMLQNPYKTANFAVLISPSYPSILVELGFLSNRDDEEMLKSVSYRKKIAKTIANSVNGYFRSY